MKTDERVVRGLGELDVAEDCAGSIRANLRRLLADGEGLQLVLGDIEEPPVWRRGLSPEDVQVQSNACQYRSVCRALETSTRQEHPTLEAQHVVAVGGDLDGQLGGLVLGPRGVIFRVLVELDAEVEAQLLEAVLGEPAWRRRVSWVNVEPRGVLMAG